MNEPANSVAENPMGTRPIYPLLLSMALPPIISMLIQSMYNIVDSVYVAKLGEDALTAVSLAYPFQNLILSLGVGHGISMNASIARNLGAGNRLEADSSVMHGLLLTGLHALLFAAAGVFLSRPFIGFFTNSPNVLSWGSAYCRIVVCFSFGSLFHIAIEKIFQSTGNMVVPMILQAVGALINIVLDPVFIFGLGPVPALGVTGAAVATIIGQVSACLLAVILFVRSDLPLHVHWKDFRFSGEKVRELYKVSIPSTVIMAVPSTLVGLLNKLLAAFSQTAVAVFGVYFKLQTFIYMPSSGVIQGMRPIVSYNYGAGKKERMDGSIRAALTVVAAIMASGTLLFLLFASGIMGIFTKEAHMLSLGVSALRIISIGFLLSAPAVVFSGALESIGLGVHSLVITFTRQIVLVLLFSFLFSRFMGVSGIWLAFPVSELLGAIIACKLTKKAFK